MDQIAQQLKAEIESLQEYIQRTEERLQVTGWVTELLDPFEQLEDDFSQTELQKVATALFHAKFRFGVNGHLSNRIDDILQRHQDLVVGLQKGEIEIAESLPAKDPETKATADSVQEDDDEEASFTIGTDGEDLFTPLAFEDDSGDTSDRLSLFQVPDMDGEPANQPHDDVSTLFLDDEPADDSGEDFPTSFSPQESLSESAPESEISDEDLGELFNVSGSAGQHAGSGRTPSPDSRTAQEEAAGPGKEKSIKPQQRSSPAHTSHPLLPSQKKARDSGQRRFTPPPGDASLDTDIFAAKISIEDLLLRLGISIPAQDKTQLQTLLHHKIADGIIPALQTNANYEKKLILFPRLARFIFDGKLVPCTVKNLAKTFITLFGNIQDLMHYKNQRFFHTEVSQLGWALVASEAPRQTVNKNFMEQTQYIRYLAASIGIPSHLVRRRTLVESVYDIIVGRMVLGNPLQQRSLDWTSSGPSKSDFVCVYYSDSGIRMRDLPRTTHNRSLGTVPTW